MAKINSHYDLVQWKASKAKRVKEHGSILPFGCSLWGFVAKLGDIVQLLLCLFNIKTCSLLQAHLVFPQIFGLALTVLLYRLWSVEEKNDEIKRRRQPDNL